jgi:hypothetical protein
MIPYFVLLGSCFVQGIMDEEIYGDRYEQTFEWAPFPSQEVGGMFPIPSRVIHLL